MEICVQDPGDHSCLMDEVEFLAGIGETCDGDATFGHRVEDLLRDWTRHVALVYPPGADWEPVRISWAGAFSGKGAHG